MTRGVAYDASRLPSLVAWEGEERVGLATYRWAGEECELVTLDAQEKGQGIGTALLAALEGKARTSGCRRVWLVTTNDNLSAIRFYQKRGYELAAVHRGALIEARRLKPTLPEIGEYGIPLRDEIEMEKVL